MSDVKDYTKDKDMTHYNGVDSFYGRTVNEQLRQQPKYCMPGEVDESGAMKGAKRNTQMGPSI